MELNNQNILVLGAGKSGISVTNFILSQNGKVTLFDQNETLLKTDPHILKFALKDVKTESNPLNLDLNCFDLLIASPGFPLDQPFLKSTNKPILGEVELASRYLKQRVIGITGTNGKTTVTLLVEHVLNESGLKAKALGNIGTPLISYLLDERSSDEILVLELSSYQLETMSTKFIDLALILNITPDHLDRYKEMKYYVQAKARIQDLIKNNGRFYINKETYDEFKEYFDDNKISLFGYENSLDLFSDLENVYLKGEFQYTLPSGLLGKKSHDLENMMGAYLLCHHFGVSKDQFLKAFLTFKKPAHRIEFVKTIDSISYYNDSKGTNIDAVIKAVNTIDGSLYLIAGGVDKGSSYLPWKDVFKGKVKTVCVIGEAATKIQSELTPEIDVILFNDLESAVLHATKKAKSGESILLSPGCSSYDMFRDYKERGDEFKRIVHLIGN